MPPITPFTAVLVVHVLSAMLLAGGGIPAAFVRQRVRQAQSGADLVTWLTFGAQAARFNPLLAGTVLVTALYMGSLGFWQAAWFRVAAALWVMDSVAAVALVQRSAIAIGAALGRAGSALSPEVEHLRLGRRWDVGLLVLRANAVATLYLMLAKPVFLHDAVWAVVVCQVVNAAVWAAWVGLGAIVPGRRPSEVGALAGR
jgi:hypothetical protein